MARALRYAVRSDKGLVRGNNEDSVYAGPRLLAIADGMGGHAAGEVASKIVITALERLDEDRPIGDLLHALRDAVEDANRDIAATVAGNRDLEGMGTTLTALRFVDSHVGLVHVGDSRAYLLRGDHLSQITHDDTYVQSLVDSGRISPEEASNHPRRSVILRALTGNDVEPDVSIREARVGDRYLLCSDGLSDVVTTATLFETLSAGTPQQCADRLVDLALRGGGPDNVTCIVADVIEETGGAMGDDVPVIAGAIVDPRGGEPIPARDGSPAERAALMTQSVRSADLDAGDGAAEGRAGGAADGGDGRRRRGWTRGPLLVLLTIAVVGAGLYGAYAWTQTQYFVGQDGNEVAVFRGVDAEFGPLKFYKVAKNTSLMIDALRPAARSQVLAGITASSQTDADNIVQNLRGEQLPSCAALTAGPTPSAGSTSSASSGPSSSATGSPGASRSGSANVGVTTTASAIPLPPTASPRPSAGVPTDSPTESATSAAPVHSPQPGVDCQ